MFLSLNKNNQPKILIGWIVLQNKNIIYKTYNKVDHSKNILDKSAIKVSELS